MRNALVLALLAACSGGTTAQPAPVAPTAPAPAPPTTGLTKDVCAQRADDFGPITLQPDQVVLRRGTTTRTFAELVSTRAAPIEVCMPEGEEAWLARVTCTDGSQAAVQRTGNVGPGGACGSIIDRYVARCPDQEYEVFLDMYMCAPGEAR